MPFKLLRSIEGNDASILNQGLSPQIISAQILSCIPFCFCFCAYIYRRLLQQVIDLLNDEYRLTLTRIRPHAYCQSMADTYEANRPVCKYVHSASRGHEAIQIATGLHLLSCDFVSPYYRDDSMLLSIGFSPYQLMLQLLAKADDPFSGGRSYYCHPSNRDKR